jgi:hypothetical protein
VHLRRRGPARPFLLFGDLADALPGEADASDPDGVTQRDAAVLHQIKPPLGGVDDNGAGSVVAGEAHAGARHIGTGEAEQIERPVAWRAAAQHLLALVQLGLRDVDGHKQGGEAEADGANSRRHCKGSGLWQALQGKRI